MKVLIDSDEWYPVYSISEHGCDEVEMTEEQVAKVNAAFVAFNEAQEELRKALENS